MVLEVNRHRSLYLSSLYVSCLHPVSVHLNVFLNLKANSQETFGCGLGPSYAVCVLFPVMSFSFGYLHFALTVHLRLV